MPTLLTPALVESSLAALYEWSGDTTAITRTVRMASAQQAADLVGAVEVSAGSLGHHPVVERKGTAVTFTLTSDEVGGVSEVDITLASHIDNLSGRLAGAAPTPAPNSAISSASESKRLASGAGRNHPPQVTVDSAGQPASAAPAAKKSRVRGGGAGIGVPSITGGGTPMPGVAAADDKADRPQPGDETEQRPKRRR
ncbi:MAG TPA: 4a-hydroxytetrahydrobiopterin dehydratase [Mycobacteriales bacterium]|nr:4a-hydroxytetrahydrobiopterin dehydratase [Mycobacteriales bacterium]